LLKHIGMEEKILLPAARRIRGGEPLAVSAQLRMDHGALTALLVPSTNDAVGVLFERIMGLGNRPQRGAGGTYDQCEQLLGTEEPIRFLLSCKQRPRSKSCRAWTHRS
jgi:hypothetical protein